MKASHWRHAGGLSSLSLPTRLSLKAVWPSRSSVRPAFTLVPYLITVPAIDIVYLALHDLLRCGISPHMPAEALIPPALGIAFVIIVIGHLVVDALSEMRKLIRIKFL